MAVNLGITHLPLGPMLQASWASRSSSSTTLAPRPVAERAGADGSAQAPASVAFLAIGTGISAGIVLDGAVLRGDNSFAGEVGHVVADPEGVVCACGLRGCLETIAAGPAIGRQADEAMAAGRSTVLSPIRVPEMSSAPLRPATRSRSRSPTGWPTTWPEPSDRSP
jgi:hypothetical protein